MRNLDLKYYRQFNTDLAHFSDVELKNHYNTFGKNEIIIWYVYYCKN